MGIFVTNAKLIRLSEKDIVALNVMSMICAKNVTKKNAINMVNSWGVTTIVRDQNMIARLQNFRTTPCFN